MYDPEQSVFTYYIFTVFNYFFFSCCLLAWQGGREQAPLFAETDPDTLKETKWQYVGTKVKSLKQGDLFCFLVFLWKDASWQEVSDWCTVAPPCLAYSSAFTWTHQANGLVFYECTSWVWGFRFTESSNTSHIKHSLALICFRVVYLNLLTCHSVGPCTVSQVKVEPSHWRCKSGFIWFDMLIFW